MYVSQRAPFQIYAWEKPTNDSLFRTNLSSIFPTATRQTYRSEGIPIPDLSTFLNRIFTGGDGPSCRPTIVTIPSETC